MNTIPILLYHGISDTASDVMAPFAVSPIEFRAHMEIVAAAPVRTIGVSRLAVEMSTGTLGTAATALVTFDDGYADFADTAFPIMSELGIASTLYVTTGFVHGGTSGPAGGPGDPTLSWSQLPELDAEGVEIGAHSHSHPQMDTLSPGRAWEELVRPKALLEDCLGKDVLSFAYPHGYNSAHIRHQVRLAGYESATGVRNMLSHPADDLFRIARLTVTRHTTRNQIRSWLAGEGPVAGRMDSPKTRAWRTFRRSRAVVTRREGNVFG